MMERVFASEPYVRRGPNPYTNLNDRAIPSSGGADGSFLHTFRYGERYVGTLTLGVEV